ncbi:hypothetical protein V5O48_019606, partial [Marasmius crinis-equi]
MSLTGNQWIIVSTRPSKNRTSEEREVLYLTPSEGRKDDEGNAKGAVVYERLRDCVDNGADADGWDVLTHDLQKTS